MRRSGSVVVAVLLLAVLTAPVGSAAGDPDPVTCTGYPEQRVYLDSQSWWLTTPGQSGNNFGHVHTATCFPLQKTVRGVVHLDVKITMHENPGYMESLTVQLYNGTAHVAGQKKFPRGQYTCPVGTCTWTIPLDVNTAASPTDGSTEWRIRPKLVEPDGKHMIGSTSYQTILANGKSVKNYRPIDYLQGKGWYTGIEYNQARFIDDQFPYKVPTSGTWNFQTECDSSKVPVSECLVTVDPDFHAGNKGKVLYEAAPGTGKKSFNLNLGTLSPGPHKIVIRSGSKTDQGSTQYGILAVPFSVAG